MPTSGKQTINIGGQPNDRTGDSVRDAFRKTNQNFDTLFSAAGLGNGLSFAGGLLDTPAALDPNKLLISDAYGLTVTQVSIVGGTGISITNNSGTITVTNNASSLFSDPNPTLSSNLIGNGFRAESFAAPVYDQDLATKKWIYDNFLNRSGNYTSNAGTIVGGSTLIGNVTLLTTATTSTHLVNKSYADSKISLAGINAIDPATNTANPAFGTMSGPLLLSRDPTDSDSPLIAATRNYVDTNGYWSANNLYVTSKGTDFQPTTPSYKRGRFYNYAFASVNRAARYAEQLIATSKIQVGDYARLITHDGGTPCTVSSIIDNYSGSLAQLVLNAGSNGSDQFGAASVGNFTIFPGQYVQGVQSGAIGLIESISKGNAGLENYVIAYVDYAQNFNTDITVSVPNPSYPNQIQFSFVNIETAPIPDFWVGYQFRTSTYQGTIISTNSIASTSGIYTDSFIVEMDSGYPTAGSTITKGNWTVWSGDFAPGETILYNTNVSSLQISILVESGEYYEQYPIKLPANTSIKGDEFRRVILRPAKGISASPWATTYFRRDTQIDGLQTTEIDTSTNYATTGALLYAAVTPGAATGLATFVLSTGTLSSSYLGYIFQGNGGQGVVQSTAGSSFTVNIGTNLSSVNFISTGSWNLYKPINFGYHYLNNPKVPINTLSTVTNNGGLINAAALLVDNRTFIQQEVVSWMQAQVTANSGNPSSPWYGYIVNTSTSYKDAGTVIDSLNVDMLEGGNGNTVNSAYFIGSVPGQAGSPGYVSTSSLAINYINTIGQKIIANTAVTPSSGNTVPQVIDNTITAEANSSAVLGDLIQTAYGIINNNPALNLPKLNDQMDIFLCNDANVIRLISCQNHGGFMMVLDPVGQVKNKSPYAQTNSSFSQSIAKQAFRGGMFIDGFAGNILAYPTTSTFTNTPLSLTVKGLVRKPQVPTFFTYNGVRYEVDFFNNFAVDPLNTTTYTATLSLNPLTPGGIPQPTSVTDTLGGFACSASNIPVTFGPPSGVGGLTATGHAITNSAGTVTNIVVDFPGTGYTTATTFTIGGAIASGLQFNSAGNVTSISFAYGGLGYTTATTFSIIPVGTTSATTATGRVTSTGTNGVITGVTITGSGTNWSSSVGYQIKFGNVSATGVNPKSGFIDTVATDPTTGNLVPFELITAGNRSMLAADFTQVNDLGYGIFVTNGSFAENVSMFTYYCHRSYYSLNGAQVRSTSGSSCYGDYGLCAEGSDPKEVPVAATSVYNLSQIATTYSTSTAIQGQGTINVVINPTTGYAPLSGSQLEINHNGVIKIYQIGSASPVLNADNTPLLSNGNPVYQLGLSSGNIISLQMGLYATVAAGTSVTIRQLNRFKLAGFSPAAFTRPSTALTMNDDPSVNYHVTAYTALNSDNSVLVDVLENYNYIQAVAKEQGLTYPILLNGGSGYSGTATVTVATSSIVTANTASVFGDQGVTTPVQLLTLEDVSNIQVGQSVTATNASSILPGTVVTFVNSGTNQIGISQNTNGTVTSATVLQFTGTLPSIRTTLSGDKVGSIIVDEAGTGWTATSVTISISGNATVANPVNIAGVIGSYTIKINPLDTASQNRLAQGFTASIPYYYQFGLNGQLYNIVAYRPASSTGQTWAEIDVDQPLNVAVAQGTILNLGLPASARGAITTRISLLRVTNHDFVDIGTGGYATTKIPNDLYGPPIIAPQISNEVIETGAARVYYVTADQNGNFNVGKAFSVNQATGSISLNAPIDLSNLNSISLKKDQGPPVTEFSTDNTMASGVDYKVPTEQAVVNYISRRLGINQNGNLYTGNVLGGGVLALNGNTPMRGSINMNGHTVSNLTTPLNDSDAGTKGYSDGKLDRRGTSATNVDSVTPQPAWGTMTGPLQLTNNVNVIVTATSAQVFNGATVLTLPSAYGFYYGLAVSGINIATGTVITAISANSITLSKPVIGTVPSGAVLTLDPINQAVTKSYVDRNAQFNQLNDVSLNNPTNQDLVMFNSTVLQPHASSGTTEAVYNTATQVINVTNNPATITNTATSSDGGSDITIVRNNNTVTFKIVGGQGTANPITDYHINNNAAIQQSKLSLKKADTSISASGLQADLGLAQFDSDIFTSTTGWVTLATASSQVNGISPNNLQIAGLGGALLGATSAGSISYLNTATVLAWLGNNSFTITNNAPTASSNSGALQVQGGVGVTGGLYVGGVVTATTFVGNLSGTAPTATTATNIAGGLAGSLVIQSGNGQTTMLPIGTANYILQSNGTTATWVSTSSIASGGISGSYPGIFTITNITNSISTNTGALQVRGGAGIAGDVNIGGGLVVYGTITATQLTIQYTTITQSIVISSDVFTITNTTVASTVTGGALQVAGGVGVQGSLYATALYDGGNRVLTSANIPSSGVVTFSAGSTGLSPNSATTGTVTLGGTLNASSGGTGVAGTITGIPYANAGSAYTAATANQIVSAIGSTYVQNASNATQAGNITAYTINQNVGSSNSPTFNGLTLSGLTGYLYGNGGSALTASSTIPGSAITGNARLTIVTATTFSAAAASNIQIGGGSNGQFLQTNGSGSLSWASVSSSITITNGTGITGGGTGNSFTLAVASPVLRHVTSGYTGGGQVSVSSTSPVSPSAGDVWFDISGATGFTQSLASPGWTQLPNGLILQWGVASSIAQDGYATGSFPVTFPTAVLGFFTTINAGFNSAGSGNDGGYATSTGAWYIYHGSDSTSNVGYFAIGH